MSDNKHNPLHGDPFQALITHFEEQGIRFSCNREERRMWFSMNSGSALQKCRFSFASKGDILQIFIQYPVLVNEKFRPLAAEFITRANYGLIVGNFEMDMKDGEVRYHISHVMPDGKLEDPTIRRLFGTAMGTADRYFPALMRVLFAGETPEDAVDLAELDQRADLIDADPRESGIKSKGGRAAKPTRENPRSKPRTKGGNRKKDPSSPKEISRDEPPSRDLRVQSTPPQIPPAPHTEEGNHHPGTEGESGDRKAA
jgi:hypothetical protein